MLGARSYLGGPGRILGGQVISWGARSYLGGPGRILGARS